MKDLDLAVTLRAVDKFSEPAKRIAGISEKMAKHLGEGQKALFQIGNNRKSVKRLQELTGSLDKTSNRLAKAREEYKYYWRQREIVAKKGTGKLSKESRQLTKELDKVRREIKRLEKAETRLHTETEKVSTRLHKAGVNTRSLREEQSRLGAAYGENITKMKKMAALSEKMQASKAKYDRALQRAANTALVAGGITRVGESMVGALRAPLNEAINFESAMADVKKVIDFKEPDGLKRLSQRLINMTRVIPITKEGLAAIAAAGGQLGVAEESIPEFVETAAKMATAFDMLPEEAGDAMAKLSNVYNIPISEMARLGDAINHLSDNTAAKAKDIVPLLQRIGGNAKQFGLSAVQAAALGDAFVSMGKKPEVAATAINAMLTKLQTASKQGKKFQAALIEMGLSAEGLEQSVAQDGQGALSGFLEQLGQLDKQTRAGLLTDLFGLEYADDISLLSGNLDQYRKALNLVGAQEKFSGSMEKEFQNRSNTTANRIQLMQQRWAALQQRIGEQLIPVLEKLMDIIGPLMDGIGGWIEKHPKLTSVVVAFTGVIGGLALIVAPVITAIASLGAAIAWMGMNAKKAALTNAMGGVAGGKGGKGLWGKVKGMGKGAAAKTGLIGAGLIGAISIGSTLTDKSMSTGEKAAAVTQDVGGIGGALAGAAAGAAIGSIVPVIGTAVGGILGSILGGKGGDWAGGKLGSLFTNNKPTAKTAAAIALSGTMAAAPVVAAPTGMQDSSTQNYQVSIQQQPGEDSQALARRVAEEIRREETARSRSRLHDEG